MTFREYKKLQLALQKSWRENPEGEGYWERRFGIEDEQERLSELLSMEDRKKVIADAELSTFSGVPRVSTRMI